MSAAPSLRHERALLRAGHSVVVGMDEVGRGSLAGPVSVGVVAVDFTARSAPTGVRDSKLLTPAAREALCPALRRWGLARAVGHASPAEIDEFGLMAAMRLAGHRAMVSIGAQGLSDAVVLLDGNHDWLTAPQDDGLFAEVDAGGRPSPVLPDIGRPVVVTRIKADQSCASVAAASVLAKVERDAIMIAQAAVFPGYQWDVNKGYASPEHLAALRETGPCEFHRRSWRLTDSPVG